MASNEELRNCNGDIEQVSVRHEKINHLLFMPAKSSNAGEWRLSAYLFVDIKTVSSLKTIYTYDCIMIRLIHVM